MRRIFISGFTIIKNGISRGYPFLESILSVLPICDEFVISDGYSDDGTWETLNKLKEKFPNKIILFQDKWEESKGIKVLRDLTTKTMRRCKGDYLLYVQADEVYHEKVLDEIKTLPSRFPKREMFLFPRINFLGPYITLGKEGETLSKCNDFEIRFIKNNPHIKSSGDSWAFSYDFVGLIKNYLFDLKNLRRLLLFYTDEKRSYINLSFPIFHYHSIFPLNHLEKIKAHKELYKNYKIQDQGEIEIRSYKEFWEKIVEKIPGGVEEYKGAHPKIMEGILGKLKYEVRESLFN